MENNFDLVIIGGGPGGVSTALYALRGGLATCIIHGGASALHEAHDIENYYGASIRSGAELYEHGLGQARALGAEIVADQATFAEDDGTRFSVTTAGHGVIAGKRMVIATGSARTRAKIDGISAFDGKGVSYCAVCDAFFYRKKRVGVIGAGEYARHEYDAISAVASEAYLLTNGDKPSFDAPHVIEKKIASVFAGSDGRLGGVQFSDGERLELDGLFIALGVMSSNAIAKSMGVLTDKNGAITVDARGMTNIKGLYAAGDCTAGIKQVGKAVADGVTVGMSVIADLKAK